MRRDPSVLVLLLLAAGAPGARAQMDHMHTIEAGMRLGTVHLATSCRPEVAAPFDRAVALLRSAAELQEKVGKHPVTPGDLLPARELLGDLLLELHRPAEALEAYEATLRSAPNRLNALADAGLAAEATGGAGRVHGFYATIVAQCRSADPARPEVLRARSAVDRAAAARGRGGSDE